MRQHASDHVGGAGTDVREGIRNGVPLARRTTKQVRHRALQHRQALPIKPDIAQSRFDLVQARSIRVKASCDDAVMAHQKSRKRICARARPQRRVLRLGADADRKSIGWPSHAEATRLVPRHRHKRHAAIMATSRRVVADRDLGHQRTARRPDARSAPQVSRKLRSFRLRLGCFSLRSAFASI